MDQLMLLMKLNHIENCLKPGSNQPHGMIISLFQPLFPPDIGFDFQNHLFGYY